MDHLPYPGNARTPRLRIPYICEGIFSSHELCRDESGAQRIPKFTEFIQWSHKQMQTGNVIDDNDQKIPLMLQAFVYFGLLKECLEQEFRLDDFLTATDASGKRMVTLKHLPQKLVEICKQKTQLSSNLREWYKSRAPELYGDFTIAHLDRRILLAQALEFARYHSTLNLHGDTLQAVSLAIEVLAWTLLDSLPISIGLQKNFDERGYNDLFSTRNLILTERLVSTGWCPYWIPVYCDTYAAPVLYYMSGLSQTGHGNCSRGKCVAFEVSASYKPQHAVSGCQCALRCPNEKRIKAIITSGSVPVLQLHKKSRQSAHVEVRVVEGRPGVSYTALSHVWAQGLGNPRENSIHECQLTFLFDALSAYPHDVFLWRNLRYGPITSERIISEPLQALNTTWKLLLDKYSPWPPSPVNVWIDSLCIPCKKEDFGLRQLSINKMAMIYAMAERVLVVDKELSTHSALTSSQLETAIKLATSPWMTRKWTFQEACLASQFSFKLRDGLLTPRSWMRTHKYKNWAIMSLVAQRMLDESMKKFDQIPPVQKATATKGKQIDPLDQVISLLTRLLRSTPIAYWKWISSTGNNITAHTQEIDSVSMLEKFIQHDSGLHSLNQLSSGRHELTEVQLSHIWKEIRTRSTSKNEDIHVILAALLGLNVRELLELRLQDRTKAILKSMAQLPLSMFYDVYDDETEMIAGYDWVPLYPAGNLIWEEATTEAGRCGNGEYMKWTPHGDLIAHCVSPIFRTSINAPFRSSYLPPEFYLGHDMRAEWGAWLDTFFPNMVGLRKKVVLSLHKGGKSWNGLAPHGFLLSMTISPTQMLGACFLIDSPWTTPSIPPSVRFLCPLKFIFGSGKDTISDTTPFIKLDTVLQPQQSFVIKADAHDWPSLGPRQSSGYVYATDSFGEAFSAMLSAALWNSSILFYFCLSLYSRNPDFKIWHLYPLIGMRLSQEMSFAIDDKRGRAAEKLRQRRQYAVAKTYDTGEARQEHTAHSQTPESRHKYSLGIRTLLGALCIGYSNQQPHDGGIWFWRTGLNFILEIILDSATEAVWNHFQLNKLESWHWVMMNALPHKDKRSQVLTTHDDGEEHVH